MFPVTSRYYGIEIATFEIAEGHTVNYLRRRFLPDSAKAVTLTEHVVTQGDRLDNVTARNLGNGSFCLPGYPTVRPQRLCQPEYLSTLNSENAA